MKTKIKASAFTFICLLSITCLFAQTHPNEQAPYIEVNGNAEKWVMPDEIYISITIKARESGRDQITVDQQESQLKQALTAINIPLENLTVSDANADYIRVKWNKKNVISQSDYLLKVATALQVSDVFEKLDKLKIDNAYISRTDHSQIVEYRKEVRIMAITTAKEKADYLLEAIGQKTGKALIVKEIYNNPARMYTANFMEMEITEYDMDKSSIINTEVSFSKIKLESNIYVKFGIE